VIRLGPEKVGQHVLVGIDRQQRVLMDFWTCAALLAQNQLGGSARNHVGRRVCPRTRNDLRHHGGVRHA